MKTLRMGRKQIVFFAFLGLRKEEININMIDQNHLL